MNTYHVTDAMRLDAFVASQSGIKSRNTAQDMIKAGGVSVNDVVVKKPSYQLAEGDTVSCKLQVSSSEELQTSNSKLVTSKDLHLTILYEDDSCLVINKPRGIAVHPAPGEKDAHTILHGIAHLFAERTLPFSAGEVLVHRLDKETTGCLLIAKTPEMHLALQKQFAERTVSKQYLALVAGIPEHETAVIDAPIGRHAQHRTSMSVRNVGSAREAKTTYTVIDKAHDCALLQCDLHTGRTHQLRVHLHAIGHPILGDPTYATNESAAVTDRHGITVLCLHAWKLSFFSPSAQETQNIIAPLPEDMLHALEAVGVDYQ